MKSTLLIFSIVLCNFLYGQISIELKENQTSNWSFNDREKLNYADKYFKNQEYLFARQSYDSLYKKHKTNLYIGYLLGSCNIYDSRYQTTAEQLIKAAESLKEKLPDYDYFLGKAYLVNDKFFSSEYVNFSC